MRQLVISLARRILFQPTDPKSRCEVHYETSRYIAEFYCTLSSLPLLVIALYYSDNIAVFVSIFSILSHAFPYQRLHDLDMLGVFLVVCNVFYNYKILFDKRVILLIYAVYVQFIDAYSRRILNINYPIIHVIWHFLAAFSFIVFNEMKLDGTKNCAR